MGTTLDAPAADRLAKILGLLGSDHSGERDAAAQAAHKLVRGLGLSWADVIHASPPPDHAPRIRSWRADDSAMMRKASSILTRFSCCRSFMLIRFSRQLTELRLRGMCLA
jgi:hypothetical protein